MINYRFRLNKGRFELNSYIMLRKRKIFILVFAFLFLFLSNSTHADYKEPEQLDLVNAPLDSVQKTVWNDYPVIVHRRTTQQIEAIGKSNNPFLPLKMRQLGYQSIARIKGNEFASAIMQFTERYVSKQNNFMSEVTEYGVYSMVSPILGCSIYKDEESFVDPCTLVRFDLTGRVIDNPKYAHLRLTIPPHQIVKNQLIFLNDYKADVILDFTPDILNMDLPDINKALLAIEFERLDILKQIVESNPLVLTQTNNVGTTVLQVTAIHDKTIDYVLSFENIKINNINKSGYTALLFAIFSKKIDNAEKLIQKGARMDAFTLDGVSAKSLEQFIEDDMYYEPDLKEVLQRLRQIQNLSSN